MQESTDTQPILTIAIPTYNRAGYLDKQLGWATRAIADRWNRVELFVADNGSPDATPEICHKWVEKTGGRLRVFRQTANVGLPRNAITCIQEARGKFVWMVSDDDEIAEGALDWLLDVLSDPEKGSRLSLVHFNVRIQRSDGVAAHERIHPFYEDKYADPGLPLFEECSKFADVSMILSSSVYRTEVVREGIRRWSGMGRNLAFPTYLAGYAAAHGAMMVHAAPAIVCIEDSSSFIPFGPIIDYYDVPEVYWLLSKEGYSAKFIRPRILGRLLIFKFIAKYPVWFAKSIRFYINVWRMKERQS